MREQGEEGGEGEEKWGGRKQRVICGDKGRL